MSYRKKFWIYGPDGKPITNEASANDGTDKPAKERHVMSRSRAYSESDAPAAPHYGRAARDPRQARNEKWKFRVEMAALIATVIGVPALVCQSYFNMRQANAAESQLAESHGDFITDERAWMFADEVKVAPDNNTLSADTFFDVIFKNSGKTPALRATCWVSECAAQDVSNLDIVFKYPNMDELGKMVGTGQIVGRTAPRFSVAQINSFHEGKAKPFIYGQVHYVDVFGHHHWSQFCYEITKENLLLDVPLRNISDDTYTNASP